MLTENSAVTHANKPPANAKIMEKDFGRVVWIADADEGFRLATINDIAHDGFTVVVDDTKQTVTRRYDETFACEEDRTKMVDDNCALMHLNEATLLNNCRLRYANRKIYSYVANILISINPYEQIEGFYSPEMAKAYRGKSIGAPLMLLITNSRNLGSVALDRRLEQTVSGHICARIGAPMRDQFNSVYSRDLYNHLALAPPSHFNYLKHGCTDFFAHPNASTSRIDDSRVDSKKFSRDSMVDDFADFERLCNALKLSGLDENQQVTFIWSTIGALLHLGNVEFEENANDSRGGCKVKGEAEPSLMNAARLLGLEPDEMRMGLCARIMQATKGGVKGTLIRVPLKPHEAAAGRDALAKAIYAKMFDWLVANVNRSIPFEKSAGYIGVLDVAGFGNLANVDDFKKQRKRFSEFFAVNSFEQFCINYCNEKLQQFFNERILRQEQELYAAEGLNVTRIEYSDNQDCIDLFERKATGLFDLLDEEAKLPRATFQHFTQRAHESNPKHFRLDTPRKSKVKSHREMRDDEGLLIRHYAGTVCYETRQFVDKNNDQLHNSLEMLVEQSTSPILVSLFTNEPTGQVKTGGRLKAASVGSKFKSQLAALLEKLAQTGTHFVRCVKPNNEMRPWKFDGASILAQLQCAGMASVLRLMQQGFPSRTSFNDLYMVYQKNLPPHLARLDARLFVKCLFHALGLDHNDFQFGLTKVFFRAGKFAEFDQMMRQDPETMKELIERVDAWLIKARWRKVQYGVWSVLKLRNKIRYRRDKIVMIQKMMRGFLTRKRFQKRLGIYRKACALLDNSREMTDILARMNEASQEKWRATADGTTRDLENLIASIRQTDMQSEIDKAVEAYEECVKRVDMIIADLKQQLQSDELKEMERKRAEQEERERRELEEKEALEREKAVKRKMEEDREKAQKEYEAQLAASQKKAEEELAKKRDKEERERLDSAVSTRLATCDGIALVTNEASVTMEIAQKPKSKYDLTNWKYADLRDAINSTGDMELLMACKDEFHRRLRIYNEWKERNSTKHDLPPTRAPLSVFGQQGASTSSLSMAVSRATMAPHLNPALTQQRYFKVTFPNRSKNGATQYGMWYAHYNGQYIQRQITAHPGQRVQLLVAGKDDMYMCELPLEQTGLTVKKGAEITANDFETMWQHYGGAPIAKWTP
ncbi:unnamed protein product [Caenorhabditis bovis]|uniref:Myosin motor domain-containing protein n=1 Tax=Caenorhabditis bovis TaxID=2654633 RepID=A0A8S1F4D2_9PELO|nr:unnamed protein product [Caenorhabditis bovis]